MATTATSAAVSILGAGIGQYLLPAIALIVAVSLMPRAIELVRARRLRPPLRVMILDHDATRRARVAALLDRAPDLELTGSTSTAAITHVLLERLGTARPDAVLVALDLPEGGGPGAAATIHATYPQIRVLNYAEDQGYPLDDLRNALDAASSLA